MVSLIAANSAGLYVFKPSRSLPNVYGMITSTIRDRFKGCFGVLNYTWAFGWCISKCGNIEILSVEVHHYNCKNWVLMWKYWNTYWSIFNSKLTLLYDWGKILLKAHMYSMSLFISKGQKLQAIQGKIIFFVINPRRKIIAHAALRFFFSFKLEYHSSCGIAFLFFWCLLWKVTNWFVLVNDLDLLLERIRSLYFCLFCCTFWSISMILLHCIYLFE
jgi:hypothetical protein